MVSFLSMSMGRLTAGALAQQAGMRGAGVIRATASNTRDGSILAATGAQQWSSVRRSKHYDLDAYAVGDMMYVDVPLYYYGDNMTVVSASQSGTLVTVNLKTAHEVPVGSLARLSGFVPSGYNVTAVVVSSSPGQFTFNATAGLGTVSTIGTASARYINELRLGQDYEFAASLEYPFFEGITGIPTNNRYRLTSSAQNTFYYSYGSVTAYYASFQIAMPVAIPASTAFGIWLVHECVAGRTGTVFDVLMMDASQLSSFAFSRHEGYVNASSSLIGSDAVMTQTSLTAISASVTGGNVPIGPAYIRRKTSRKTYHAQGNSIPAGNQEGYGASVVQNALGTVTNVIYGDASGSHYGNIGFVNRLMFEILGYGVSAASKGSDSNFAKLQTGISYNGRLAGWTLSNPYFGSLCNPHNDISGGFAVAGGVATNTAWATGAAVLDGQVRLVSGVGYYLYTKDGTLGSSAPSATSGKVTDGTAEGYFLFPRDNPSQSDIAAAWVAAEYALLKKIRQVVPAIKIMGETVSPDGSGAQTVPITNAAYSGTSLTLTVASGALVGQNVTVAGLAPAGFNGTFPVTGNNGTSVTVAIASGLPSLATTIGTLNSLLTNLQDQTASPGFGASNSARSYINDYIRKKYGANHDAVLGYVGYLDLGAATEAGNPTTRANETAKWAPLLDGSGRQVESGASQDRTHPVSSSIVASIIPYLRDVQQVGAMMAAA
jgi:hypothetical protein